MANETAVGIYLLTPPNIPDTGAFAAQAEEALSAGDIACVQIRLKRPDGGPVADADVCAVAERLIPLARARSVPVVINDRPDVAVRTGADGVHVGPEDMSCRRAREIIGPAAIVGVSCRNSRHLACIAGEEGADYVSFGAFSPTATKDTAHRAHPDILSWWREVTNLPSVAIGGIGYETAPILAAAGADYLAVCSCVWGYPLGPGEAVKRLAAAIAGRERPKG